ncbi:glycosyl transferase [Stutzerimonas stutzeri]|uniref:glycosyl transferase n=1 Tax=Stutzerimonas stutzeri TaxID=316 RepID=UPI0024495474|nr:glycosyl transferase [Stutzerimonas stutzeri]MDH0101602.1 glycosyl transferase [Stutzerimonas stutzeri]
MNVTSRTPFWLKVVKPGGLPIEPIPGASWFNKRFWGHALATIDDFATGPETLLAIGKPSALASEVLNRLHHCSSLYDAMDDFPAFYAGVSRLALAQRERSIAQRVDTVWVSSTELRARWERYRNDVCLVRNGLDIAALPEQREVPTLSAHKSVFGYVGTMASWFDWDWVSALAKTRPSDVIRLIGPVFAPPVNKLPSNVQILPACGHAEAMKAMMRFDIGLIPFKINALTASVDPIKFYEYRALDLPVISTNFGEMKFRSDMTGVFISRSGMDTELLVKSALEYERDSVCSHTFALQNSWEARFNAAGLIP